MMKILKPGFAFLTPRQFRTPESQIHVDSLEIFLFYIGCLMGSVIFIIGSYA